MRESVIEKEVCRFAESRGWLVRKIAYVGRRNAPDRFFAKRGRIIFLELKAPGQKPRPGQDREIERMLKAGIDVRVVDSIEAGCAIFA